MTALAGIRVLDLGESLAADYTGRLLADYGADVIKVEPPGGSRMRSEGFFRGDRPDPDGNLLFWHLNLGKRSVVVDRSSPEGQLAFEQMLSQADVLITSGGEDHERFRRVSPRLVTVSLTGFGDSGPYAAMPGSEMLCQAWSASMISTGWEGREPLSGAGRRGEYAAGVFAYIGTLTALFARAGTGAGQHVDISVMESIAAMGQCFTTHYEYSGYIWNRHRHLYYPRTCYPTKNGHVCFAFTPGTNWPKFVEIACHPGLSDPRFATPKGRVEHRHDLDRAMIDWLSDKTASQVEELCQQNRLPVTKVMTAADLLTDSHLGDRGYWRQVEVDSGQVVPFTGPSLKLSKTPAGPPRRPPRLGEHTAEVLGAAWGSTI